MRVAVVVRGGQQQGVSKAAGYIRSYTLSSAGISHRQHATCLAGTQYTELSSLSYTAGPHARHT